MEFNRYCRSSNLILGYSYHESVSTVIPSVLVKLNRTLFVETFQSELATHHR